MNDTTGCPHLSDPQRLFSLPHKLTLALFVAQGRIFLVSTYHCKEWRLLGTGAPIFEALNFGAFLKSELETSYDAHHVENSSP